MSAEPTNSDSASDQGPDETPSREKEGREVSIFVRAMRQLSDRRDVAVWEGEPVRPGPALSFAFDSGTKRGEELRNLRTELLMRAGPRRGGAALYAVLGSGGGEGRTQLCAELALAFSQLSGRTLLVDADLRHPRLDKLFTGARPDQGLSEVLLGKLKTVPLHPVMGYPGLALLTAGTPPPNPVDLLSGAHFERLVKEWSRTYDYVLIDTPPSTHYSDGIVVANAAHSVILVARRNETSFADFTELQRRLNATQTRIVGAVLNDF